MRKLSLWMRAHPMIGDGAIALLLALMDGFVFITNVNSQYTSIPPWYITLPIDAAMVAPLVIRRRHPVVSSYLVLAVGIAHGVLQAGVTNLFAALIAVYTLVAYTTRKHAAGYTVLLVCAAAVQAYFQSPGEPLYSLIMTTAFISIAWAVGEYIGARRAYHRELEARLKLLETERDHAATMAVAQERSRIARELHDVVAHSVSVIVVQADGASYALRQNPDTADRAIRTISETGRSALTELRRLLDVLRNTDADEEPRVPQPEATELTELVDRVRAAGLPVRLELDELDELPAGVSLGVYRIVQEALTNTLKHAGEGAEARVTVRREDGNVRVEAYDDGAGRARQLTPAGDAGDTVQPPGGNGVIGMRERAHVYGGSLDAGPGAAGGWHVTALLPTRLS